MTTTTAPITKERLMKIADRLYEYIDELDDASCRLVLVSTPGISK